MLIKLGTIKNNYMKEKTIGEKRVRTDFNVTSSSIVDDLKKKSAELIDDLERLKGDGNAMLPSEKVRLISLAQTAYEEAAMWAVKAATY
jgi:hypothetical protein